MTRTTPATNASPARGKVLRTAGWVAAVCWAALAAGCAMPAPPEAPPRASEAGPGGRRQPLALNPRQELAVGRRAYQQVLDEFRDRLLPGDSPEVRRVRHVAGRLIKAAEIEPLQR